MEIVEHKINNEKIAELISDSKIIQNCDNGIDLVGNLYFQGFDKIIIHESNIVSEFFDLENGMAGEILQKFSTYRVRLMIVGDFTKYTRKSIKDFIFESNKGKHINFLSSVSDAINILTATN